MRHILPCAYHSLKLLYSALIRTLLLTLGSATLGYAEDNTLPKIASDATQPAIGFSRYMISQHPSSLPLSLSKERYQYEGLALSPECIGLPTLETPCPDPNGGQNHEWALRRGLRSPVPLIEPPNSVSPLSAIQLQDHDYLPTKMRHTLVTLGRKPHSNSDGPPLCSIEHPVHSFMHPLFPAPYASVQSLSKQSDLEAMVKTLAPVLLAELANLKSSSAASSSSSLKTEKKMSSTKSTKATSSHSKRRTGSSTKSMFVRSMSSSKVSLSGVFTSLSHTDMVEAMEKLGKVKSVILYRSTLQAQVHFEKEEDARKLQSLQSYQVKGLPVYIDRPTGVTSEKPPLTKEQKTAPQKKPASSSATKSQTTKSHFTGRVKKPLSTEAKNTTTSKLVTRAKVLVSKAKGVSTKQVAKTVKKPSANRKGAVKPVGGKKEASVVPKSKTPGKRPQECPSDSSDNKGQPTPDTSSSVSQTPTTSARSVYKDIGKAGSTSTDMKARKQNAEKVATSNAPHKTAAELPQMDVDIFKVLTTEINKHRRSKGIMSESKDKEDKNKDFSSGRFDELDFTSGDFVTVDEINEEMDDTTVEDHPSSSKTTSREKKDRRSSAVHSAARKISARSASSSSKPAKGNLSSRSTSVSANNQKRVSEPKKSYSGQKTSTSTSSKPTSSGQKAQSNKRKPSVTSSEPSSSGQSTRSSLSAIRLSGETQQAHKKDVKPRERTVGKSDQKASAESCAANTVESNSETSSQMALPAEGQMETDFKDETVKEVKKSRGKEKKKDTDGKSTEEEKGNKENKKIIDSPNKKPDKQENRDHWDRKTETQIPEPAQDQIIHQGGLQVVASAENDEACSDECHEMEIDESTKLQDSAPEDQAATADDGDKGPTMMQVSEKDETKGAHSSEGSSVRDTPDRNQVTSEDTNQIQSSSGVAADVKQKEEILLSEKICETSKEVGQISSEVDQPLENNDSKDTLKVQKHVGPTDLLPKADDEPTEEEVYQVIDSLEDQPTTTEAEPETEKKDRKKGDATTSGDDRPTRHDRSRSRTSKNQEKEKSSKKQERTIEKHEETKELKKEDEEKSHEDFEEMIYEVVDSIEDDSVEETSTAKTSGRKRSARGNKKDEKTSAPVKEPKKSDKEEEMFTVLDSVEEENPSDKPVVTRSRGRKDKKVEETSKTREDKTPTRRRCTPARDSQEKDRDKTLKTDVSVPLKESTPTKKSDAVVANTSEEDATCEELYAVRDDRPITQKSRRGRQKKDNKTSKKETEEEKPAYQIVGSLGVDEFREKTTTVASSLQKESETKDKMAANVTTVPSVSSPLDLQQAIRKEENLLELDENTMEAKEDPSAEGSDAEKNSTSETDFKKDDKSPLNQPNGKGHGLENRKESPKTNNTTAAIGVSLNIDQVGAKEENYPHDATEEAELKKIEAAATKTENEVGDRSMERETVERRSQSSVEGGESGKMTRDDEQNREEDIGEVEMDTFGSAILHEAGANAVSEAVPWDRTISEGEPQELVALNEIAENKEDPKEKPIMPGAQPEIQEGQLVDPLKPETFSALDEGGQTEDKKADEDDTIQTSSSSKRKHSDDPDVDKRRQELSGPEAKRSCSQSPSVAVNLQLPPFNPENPLGEEFVVPKSGFFCNLCSVFYLNESTAKKIHCSSQKHYENLLKHYQKLQQKTSGTTPSVQD
ncbi:hypothetical protein CRENBAI_016473 [Crenichthys baileyi]|uniref:Matrin-type domain-containing protein n=1 Tax=Crenichthys baileyi TaxID=28760 RepID=A0AAV9SBA3_9TELE